MNRTTMTIALPALIALTLSAPATAEVSWPELSGPYLGQTPPGPEPEVFAPGLVSTGWSDRDLIISPDGTEIYFGMLDRAGVFVRCTRLVDGRWTEPVIPSFATDPTLPVLEMSLTADGRTIMFLSTLPIEGETRRPGWANQNIFACDRDGDGWGEPYPIAGAVNTTDNEYYPSLTDDGTLYYTHHRRGEPAKLWRSRLVDGRYDEPERLPERINGVGNVYNAFIARDESYLIMCIGGAEENLGPADYWVSFRNAEDRWSEAVNLGPKINDPDSGAGSAWVSNDGKYLFYSATHAASGDFFPDGIKTLDGMKKMNTSPGNGATDIYWVSAEVVQALRPEGW